MLEKLKEASKSELQDALAKLQVGQRVKGAARRADKTVQGNALMGGAGAVLGVGGVYVANRYIDNPETSSTAEAVGLGGCLLGSLGAHVMGHHGIGAGFTSAGSAIGGSMAVKLATKQRAKAIEADPDKARKDKIAGKGTPVSLGEGDSPFDPAPAPAGEGGGAGALPPSAGPRARWMRRRRMIEAALKARGASPATAGEMARELCAAADAGLEGLELADTSGDSPEVAGLTDAILGQLIKNALASVKPSTSGDVAGLSGLDLALAEAAGMGYTDTEGDFVSAGADGDPTLPAEVAAELDALAAGEAGAFERVKARWNTRKARARVKKLAKIKKQKAYERKMMAKAQAEARRKQIKADQAAQEGMNDLADANQEYETSLEDPAEGLEDEDYSYSEFEDYAY